MISLGTLLWLAQIGLDDKYIQQEDENQEKAFQLAFTLQTMLCISFLVMVAIALPIFAIALRELGHPRSRLRPRPRPAGDRAADSALGLLPADGLRKAAPAADVRPDHQLRRDDRPGRGGAGYWALVIGTVAGSWASGLLAARATPYPLRFHYERGAIRDYADFSWPLIAGSASGILVAQIPVLIAQRQLGTAAIGAITLAASMGVYAQKVDDIVTTSIYPAICRVRDRIDLLQESFTKSNRLALLWSLPLGVAVALFAEDLVHYVIGDHWELRDHRHPAVRSLRGDQSGLLQLVAFLRALGTTRPMALAGGVMLVAVLASLYPGSTSTASTATPWGCLPLRSSGSSSASSTCAACSAPGPSCQRRPRPSSRRLPQRRSFF